MPTFRGVLGFINTETGATWSITNYFDEDNANTVRGLMDDWVGPYLTNLCPNSVGLKFAKVVSELHPGLIHVDVSYPVSSFTPHIGGIIGGEVYDDAAYMLVRASGSLGGGSAYWKLHGIDKSLVIGADKWGTTGVAAVRTASLAYFNQYRRVATPPFVKGSSRGRGLPVVDPPVSWPSIDISDDLYHTKTGRPFSLPGVQRR